MEFFLIFGGSIGMVGIVAAVIVAATAKSEAAGAIERAIEAGNREAARAVLISRGHLLRKSVRDDAKVWLLEQDDAAEKKR